MEHYVQDEDLDAGKFGDVAAWSAGHCSACASRHKLRSSNARRFTRRLQRGQIAFNAALKPAVHGAV
jgi:hypothetical protein